MRFPFFSKKRVYLDYASATPVLPQAQRAVREASRLFGNPGSIHAEGVAAKKSLQESREKIAFELGVKARELVFVSGGTEANNLCILGFARALSLQGKLDGTHWITSVIEHPSVLECFSEIERLGGDVSHITPDKNGIIHADELQHALRKQTVFVSLAWANHELGVVQPISALAQVIRAHEQKERTTVLLHVDAGQAPLYKSVQLHSLDADLVSLDSGKLYGPRGIGAVYISNRAELAPQLLGGGQERGLRAGTENVALASGFAEALRCIGIERANEAKRVGYLRETLMKGLESSAPESLINGELSRSLPHILNISFPGIKSEYLTLSLDSAGIAVATKSACREGEESVSHVVEALGGPDWRAKNTIRFSLGRETSAKDIQRVLREFARLSHLA